ncbi:MAG TPA: hypothetical protein PKW28_09555 [Turneriella sp.]|nr:hypothetical protein [Turneriella sp.]HNN01199.1 hypothetical protein [Turneriella sp.]
MRLAIGLSLVCLGILPAGCALLEDDAKKKEGICIHGMSVIPKDNNCGTCTAGSPTCDTKYYTYCSDEKKTEDCTNQSAACSLSMTTKADYDDTITFYDGGKRCDTSGYTVTCSNPKYKASDAAYCPP